MKKICKYKNIIICILVFAIIGMTEPKKVLADSDGDTCEVGIAVVGNYSYWDDLNNLNAPTDIGDSIYSAFKSGKAKNWGIGFQSYNHMVDVNMFKAKSLGGSDHRFADNVDLLFYSGHGLKPGYHGAIDYSFALCYDRGEHRAKQGDMRLGNRDLEWLVTFTCNFCKGSNDEIGRMASGVHSICGFSTGVVLTSNMGQVMCSKLKSGVSVKEAFFATAHETQPWKDQWSNRTACVFTTNSCADDRIWGYGTVAKDPVSYAKKPSSYVKYSYDY